MAVNFPQVNTYAIQGQPIDFSGLQTIIPNFWRGQEVGRQRGLREALAQGLPTDPQGNIDWAKAASIVGQFNPELGMRTAAYAQKNEMNPYQAIMAGVAQQNANTNTTKATKPSSAAMTQSFKAEDDRDSLKATIANLKEAKGLLEGGIYQGGLAPVQTELGSQWNYGNVLGKAGLVDPAKAQRSQAYQQIISPEAMTIMANQLKGSTAYQEIKTFERIYANPAIPNDVKAKQLERAITAAQRHLDTKERRIQELRGGSFGTQDEGDTGGDNGPQEWGGPASPPGLYNTPQGPKTYLGNDQWSD